jgi:hypothetical protein
VSTTKEDVERAIADGTIFKKLMDECIMTPDKTLMKIEMPQWFSLLTAQSQERIISVPSRLIQNSEDHWTRSMPFRR